MAHRTSPTNIGLSMLAGLSAHSAEMRYLFPVAMSPERARAEAARISGGRLTLVVTDDDGQIIAVGELVQDQANPACAEGAVVVADAYQGEGIGTAIVGRLTAGATGISVMRALVRVDNRPMRRLIAGLGRPYRSRFEEGTISYEITAGGEG